MINLEKIIVGLVAWILILMAVGMTTGMYRLMTRATPSEQPCKVMK